MNSRIFRQHDEIWIAFHSGDKAGEVSLPFVQFADHMIFQ